MAESRREPKQPPPRKGSACASCSPRLLAAGTASRLPGSAGGRRDDTRGRHPPEGVDPRPPSPSRGHLSGQEEGWAAGRRRRLDRTFAPCGSVSPRETPPRKSDLPGREQQSSPAPRSLGAAPTAARAEAASGRTAPGSGADDSAGRRRRLLKTRAPRASPRSGPQTSPGPRGRPDPALPAPVRSAGRPGRARRSRPSPPAPRPGPPHRPPARPGGAAAPRGSPAPVGGARAARPGAGTRAQLRPGARRRLGPAPPARAAMRRGHAGAAAPRFAAAYRFTTPVLILICLTRGSAMVPRAPREGGARSRRDRGRRRRAAAGVAARPSACAHAGGPGAAAAPGCGVAGPGGRPWPQRPTAPPSCSLEKPATALRSVLE